SNTLADADGLGTIGYQWQRDGVNVAGATGTTYTLGNADVGHTIDVVASYTDGHGTLESKASAATAAVTNVNDPPTGTVTISATGSTSPAQPAPPIRWAMPTSPTPSMWWRATPMGTARPKPSAAQRPRPS